MVPIYIARTSIMNSIYPLQKSILMVRQRLSASTRGAREGALFSPHVQWETHRGGKGTGVGIVPGVS